MFARILPLTSQRLHQIFGEQYTETVKDSLGEHTVLRNRAVRQVADLPYRKPSGLKPG